MRDDVPQTRPAQTPLCDGTTAPDEPLLLAQLHADALFTYDSQRRIHLQQPAGRPAPRCFLARTPQGIVWRHRCDLDEAIVRLVQTAIESEPVGDEQLHSPHGAQPYEAALAISGPVTYRRAGPVFAFPRDLPQTGTAVRITPANADLLHPHLDDWREDVLGDALLFASVVDGCAVSICMSSRSTQAADEAGVGTATGFRGRGLARTAVLAWAQAVRDRGRIPLYSTTWDNTASQALARSLGLIRFAADLALG